MLFRDIKRTLNLIFIFITIVAGSERLQAQSISINTDGSAADPSAALDVKSTNKGVLVPRITKTERNNITTPAAGLLVYQSGPDSTGFYFYDGSAWAWVTASNNLNTNAWKLNGNSGSNPATNFMGTTDNQPLVFRAQNAEKMRLTPNGELAIGVATPNATYGFAKVEIASEGFGAPTDLLIRNAVNNAGYAPGLVLQHARGTLAAPLTVSNGDYLGAFSTMNYDGTGYVLSAGLDIYADDVVSTGIVPTRLMFNTMNSTGGYASRLTIKSDGKTGIGTSTPNSTLHVDGTFAMGTTMAVTGGASGSPFSLSGAKSYIGLSPVDGTNNYYQLPDPASCAGRMYVIRNNSTTEIAKLVTAAGVFFVGASSTGSADYWLNSNGAPKTVMAISDGSNWTIGRID